MSGPNLKAVRCWPKLIMKDYRHPEIEPAQSLDQVSELVGDGRVDLYAGFCARREPEGTRRRRSSISACRHRQAPAAYPQTSGGPPSIACAGRRLSRRRPFLALLRVGFTEPPRSPGVLVGSYPTVSPLPSPSGDGGLFSVALSRGSPRVAVSNHPALWSPDVPRRQVENPPTRPPGRLVRRALILTTLSPHPFPPQPPHLCPAPGTAGERLPGAY